MGGFQRVFEDDGGKVVKKLWPPLVTPDYTPYLAQLSGVDAVVQGFAGSNPLKFMKQYADAGVKLPVLGGGTAGDDALLKSFGDEAIGMISASAYTSDLDSPSNKHFVAGMVRDYGCDPWAVRRRPVHQRHGRRGGAAGAGRQDRRQGGARSRRCGRCRWPDSPRGPFHFDHFGNVVGTCLHPPDGTQGRQAGAARRSRPIRTPASSGRSTRSGSSRSRCIRAIIRR